MNIFHQSGKSKLLLLIFLLQALPTFPQNPGEEMYVPETDTLVLQKLGQWQGLKFGLLMHWGAYSQWGIVESWSLCPEEYEWCNRKMGSNPANYYEYVKEYEALKTTFNPIAFEPGKWAEAAKYAGMKYVVFTTKHHDGFTMFDSKYTDYKVTDAACPFSANPRADITKEIFDAFRKQGFWMGAYFSKPDWHCPDYWDPYYPPRDRNVNYEPETNPEKWQRYVEFTHKQVMELMSNYGKVDILWLDGGWVAKDPKETIMSWYNEQLAATDNAYLKHRMVNQDIRMDELVVKARSKQPGLIVVDRAVYGKNQNYLTPENRVPDSTLDYPWESCIISGGGWAHTKDAQYMSGMDGIHLLVDIVAKGGNLLLNIAPTPEGEWQQGAYDLLKTFGDWMKVNSEAIYDSHPLAPYKENNICMTQLEDGTAYFIYLAAEGETALPDQVVISSHTVSDGAVVSMPGIKKPLQWKKNETQGFTIKVPAELRKQPPSQFAWVFKVTAID